MDVRLCADRRENPVDEKVLRIKEVHVVGRHDTNPENRSEPAEIPDTRFVACCIVAHEFRKKMRALPAGSEITQQKFILSQNENVRVRCIGELL